MRDLAVNDLVKQVLRQAFQADCGVGNAGFDRQVLCPQIFDAKIAVTHGLSGINWRAVAVGNVRQRALHACSSSSRCVVDEHHVHAALPSTALGKLQAVVAVYGIDAASRAQLTFDVPPHQHHASKVGVIVFDVAQAAG